MKSAAALEASPSGNRSLTAAGQAWAAAIGHQHVISDQTTLSAAATATFQTGRTIPLILRPGSVADVQECLRIANQFRVPVYPVSSGMNWGYGSKVPSANGCALMELARMNAITDFSEELGYVTVEPGVTQCQLFEFLRDRKSRLWMDATGASPDSSLLGNTMERGFGHTPYGDHFKHVSGFEVVMPQGDLVKTGFSRLEGATAAPV